MRDEFFTNYSVRKGDRVYVLDRRRKTGVSVENTRTSYEIEECKVFAVGRRYLTVKCGGGLQERFERLSESLPGYGLWLECTHFDGYPNMFKKRLFPTRDLAERNKAVLEKADTGKTGENRYPFASAGNDLPYFPPLYEKPDCGKCEKRRDCFSYGKYQRDRRDFSYTSGRCPRLPDTRGFVEQDERGLYARTFPLLHAESAGETLHLSLSLPDAKRTKKVTRSKKYGVWIFRDGDIRRVLDFPFTNEQEVLDHMDDLHADRCVFPVNITDDYL